MKRHVSAWGIVTIAGFALSCFGLLLFLWMAFGGPAPLSPKGYRMDVVLPDALRLSENADVRISGVSVGKVVTVELPEGEGRTRATLEIDSAFAPRPSDTRATLRQKSLLGETFIELSPGSADAPALPEGAALAPAQVAASVRIDEVWRTFDAPTRRAFQTWMIEQGAALSTTARALNDALGTFEPFTDDAADVVATLDAQDEALRTVLRDGSTALTALSARPGEFTALIREAGTAFGAIAARDDDLAATMKALPGFLGETRTTLDRLASFSRTSVPVVEDLRPAARELAGVARAVPGVARPLERLLEAAPALERVARDGVPAVKRTLDDAEPLLERLRPFLGGVLPIVDYAADYRRELAATVANAAAATQSTLPGAATGEPLHLLRAVATLGPESLAAYPARLRTSRGNPLPAPGSYARLRSGLESFSGACGGAGVPRVGDGVPATLRGIVERFYAPPGVDNVPCTTQGPLGASVSGVSTVFPVLTPRP